MPLHIAPARPIKSSQHATPHSPDWPLAWYASSPERVITGSWRRHPGDEVFHCPGSSRRWPEIWSIPTRYLYRPHRDACLTRHPAVHKAGRWSCLVVCESPRLTRYRPLPGHDSHGGHAACCRGMWPVHHHTALQPGVYHTCTHRCTCRHMWPLARQTPARRDKQAIGQAAMWENSYSGFQKCDTGLGVTRFKFRKLRNILLTKLCQS
jgi:hypothetical protein